MELPEWVPINDDELSKEAIKEAEAESMRRAIEEVRAVSEYRNLPEEPLSYTKERILEMVQEHWIKEFGSMKALDERCYFMIGFLNSVFPNDR